jgi:hypothetical protein
LRGVYAGVGSALQNELRLDGLACANLRTGYPICPTERPIRNKCRRWREANGSAITARDRGNSERMTNLSPRWSQNSPPNRRSAPPPQKSRQNWRCRPHAYAERRPPRHAAVPWDFGLAKRGHKNILLSENNRPEPFAGTVCATRLDTTTQRGGNGAAVTASGAVKGVN